MAEALDGHTRASYSILDHDCARDNEVYDERRIAQKDSTGTPLHFAVEYNNMELVKLLLSNKAKANATDSVGQAALHRVAGVRFGLTEILEMPVQVGTNIWPCIKMKRARSISPLDLSSQ